MRSHRWVVLGLAHPRAAWFSTLARWATSGIVPIEFVKCVSADELRVRLASTRPWSAVLVGDDVPGLDRDLIATAHDHEVPVIVVGDAGRRDWTTLGVTAVLAPDFGRPALVDALDTHTRTVERVPDTLAAPPVTAPGWRGRLVAVIGAGGSGTSVVAAALAQGLADRPSTRGTVLLVDACRRGSQGVIHDIDDPLPGLPELVDAHRTDVLAPDEVRDQVRPTRAGHHLLPGLRRPRDWTALRPRALAATLTSCRSAYRTVVVDCDADLDGLEDTGSADVDDRHRATLTTLDDADLVVAVGRADLLGIHALSRLVGELGRRGVGPERLLVACNRMPRSPLRRHGMLSALRRLLDGSHVSPIVAIGEHRDLEAALGDGGPLPRRLATTVAGPVAELLDRLPARLPPEDQQPVGVVPGTLGHWSEEAG